MRRRESRSSFAFASASAFFALPALATVRILVRLGARRVSRINTTRLQFRHLVLRRRARAKLLSTPIAATSSLPRDADHDSDIDLASSLDDVRVLLCARRMCAATQNKRFNSTDRFDGRGAGDGNAL